jgi:hypothetical protein
MDSKKKVLKNLDHFANLRAQNFSQISSIKTDDILTLFKNDHFL